MSPRFGRRRLLAGAGCLAISGALPSTVRAEPPSIDVSYLWSPQLEAILDYREAVAEVLGPGVAKNLRVVRGPRNYGLVYDRAGTDLEAARRVAKEHQRLLARRFETDEPLAVPIVDRGYRRVSTGRAGGAVERPGGAPEGRPPTGFPRLPATSDTALRHRVNQLVQDERARGVRITAEERTAWYAYTLHDDRTWVAINADTPMQCASMMKPFVALAYAHQVKRGRLRWDPAAQRWLRRMLMRSDNPSTNALMRRLGGPEGVQAILSAHYAPIFRQTSIVELIPEDGRTYRNRASARDYVRFARALWHRRLPDSEHILGLMASSRHSRIEPRFGDARVAHKTGTTARLCGDFGIIETGRLPYVMVGIIERPERASRYATWLTDRAALIRAVSTVVYRDLDARYGATAAR